MISSVTFLALAVAGGVGFAAADSGCAPLTATAEGAGLQQLTQALSAATPTLLTTEAGGVVLGAASLALSLPAGQRVTVFAPTDDAFVAAAEKFGGEIPQEALADILLNHIVASELTAEAIITLLGENGGSVTVNTLLGSELFVSTDGIDIFVQSAGLEAPGATVTIPDQITCVGPIHVVDTVLLPAMPDGSVVEFGAAAPIVVPEIAPAEFPGLSEFDLAPEALAPGDITPGFAPIIATVPGFVVDGPESFAPVLAPTEGPLGTTRGLGPLQFAVEPTAFEPAAEDLIIAPLGDEPTEGPIEGLVEGPSLGPSEGPGSAEGLIDGSVPTVQEEADSAFSASFVSSTVVAAAVLALALVA